MSTRSDTYICTDGGAYPSGNAVEVYRHMDGSITSHGWELFNLFQEFKAEQQFKTTRFDAVHVGLLTGRVMLASVVGGTGDARPRRGLVPVGATRQDPNPFGDRDYLYAITAAGVWYAKRSEFDFDAANDEGRPMVTWHMLDACRMREELWSQARYLEANRYRFEGSGMFQPGAVLVSVDAREQKLLARE